MSEKFHGLPQAKVEKSYLTWSLWLLPIIAAAVCVYFVLHDVVFAGPTITIYFQNADGLQEQNSMVKYRGIKIGDVESVKLVDNGQRVAVKAKLDHSAATVARQGSIFWIVRPEIKLGAIQGLRTIVAGNYVTVLPGVGARTNIFTGDETAPITPAPSIEITLLASDLGSLEKQSPVFYRDIQVGEVLDSHLADDARHVVIRARIRADYAPLVRVNSKFWNAGGIHIQAGLFSGLQISAESFETLLTGGIAFATPDDYGAAATNGTIFTLNEKEDDSWESWNPAIPLQNVSEAQKTKSALLQINSR
jgi:paraquat-inducible protein B